MLLLACPDCPRAGLPEDPVYVIANETSVTSSRQTTAGTLQLMMDKRLPGTQLEYEYIDSVRESTGVEVALYPAILRFVDLNETVLYSDTLERAVASFAHPPTMPDSIPWVALTLDYTCGWGSYCGPITQFVRVFKNGFDWLVATDPDSGISHRITLMSSLKTDWRYDISNGFLRILKISCSPDYRPNPEDTVAFNVTYTIYELRGNQWIRRQRNEKGIWEVEDEFDITKFDF